MPSRPTQFSPCPTGRHNFPHAQRADTIFFRPSGPAQWMPGDEVPRSLSPQLFLRPNGPAVFPQAQRAGTMDAGGRSPPVTEPPKLFLRPNGPALFPQAQRASIISSGPAGRHYFTQAQRAGTIFPRPNGPAQWMPGDEVPRSLSPPNSS